MKVIKKKNWSVTLQNGTQKIGPIRVTRPKEIEKRAAIAIAIQRMSRLMGKGFSSNLRFEAE